jgi:hypothetical protein
LVLSGNQLNGTLPECFGNMPKLQQFDLSNNNLFGSVWIDLLHVERTQLTHFQQIPDSWGQISTISLLRVSHNNLEGTIPLSFRDILYSKFCVKFEYIFN